MMQPFTRWLAVPALAMLLMNVTACDNLKKGTRIKPLAESRFFADGQSSRVPPPHSIAQGQLQDDALLYTGRGADGKLAAELPWPVNEAVIARGQVVYGAICSSCHGADGYGDGIIVRRGFPAPPSYHQPRLVDAPVGHFFDVITNGYGAMYPYASIVEVNDRWAVVAYIRALQRSQHASQKDVPAGEWAKLIAEAPH
jgi:mono/diheme cytochrome c family protein